MPSVNPEFVAVVELNAGQLPNNTDEEIYIVIAQFRYIKIHLKQKTLLRGLGE